MIVLSSSSAMHAHVGVEDPQDRMFGIMLQPSHMARASERTMCTLLFANR